MVLNPEAQAKAQKELDTVIGPDRLPTWEDRPNLPYIGAIIKETIRWNSATPLGVPHAVIEDDIYEGKFIPAGATVIANQWYFFCVSRERDDRVDINAHCSFLKGFHAQ